MMGQRRQGGNRNLALACASARLPCAQGENSISLRDQLRCMAKEPADQPLTSVWCRVAGRPAGRFWRRKRTLAGEFREASPRGWTRGAGCVGSRPRRSFPILAEIIRVDLDAKMAPPPPPMCRPSGTIGLQPLTRGGPSRRAPSRSARRRRRDPPASFSSAAKVYFGKPSANAALSEMSAKAISGSITQNSARERLGFGRSGPNGQSDRRKFAHSWVATAPAPSCAESQFAYYYMYE